MTDNIEVFTQSSIRIRSEERTIYFDPFQMREEPKDAEVFVANVKDPIKVEIRL